MSEIIDIVTLLPVDSPYFSVDTSGVLSTSINNSAGTLVSAGGYTTFMPGDNFIVLSAGFVLPESFCMAKSGVNLLQKCPAFNLALVKSGTFPTNRIGPAVSIYDNTSALPTSIPLIRYIAKVTANGWTVNHVYQGDFALGWTDITPVSGMITYVMDVDADYTYNGAAWVVVTTTSYPIPNFGDYGIQLPLENYETPLGIFVDVFNLPLKPNPFQTSTFTLRASFRGLDEASGIFPQVSMVGVPTVLNQSSQNITVFLKILHNLPLVSP